jgi:hypothetical protein
MGGAREMEEGVEGRNEGHFFHGWGFKLYSKVMSM